MTASTETKGRPANTADATPSQSTAVATQQQEPRAIAIVDGVEITALIRERDDEAMLAAFMGEVTGNWFYEFEVAGKKIEGVGVIGADEFARIQAERGCPIGIPPYGVDIREATQNDERGIRATVIMRDQRTKRESVGVAFYPYYLKKRDGSKVFDDKADRKALSVAKRNAILDLIPQAEILAVLHERKRLIALNQERINKQVAATRDEVLALPAPRTVTREQLASENTADGYAVAPLPSMRPVSAVAASAAPPVVAGDKASEEQIEIILDLMEEPQINAEAKAKINGRLRRGMSQATAEKWIADLRRATGREAQDDDELPLKQSA
jgi:BarA-like signal transduction histidine kinase